MKSEQATFELIDDVQREDDLAAATERALTVLRDLRGRGETEPRG